MALDKGTGILRVANLRLLRLAANDNGAVFIEENNRRSRVFTDKILDNFRHSIVINKGDSRVCRSQVDPIDFVTHAIVPSLCDSVFVVASSDVVSNIAS